MDVTTAAMRAARRRERRERERRETADWLRLALLLALTLAAFALGGTADYADRTQGLGASMVPGIEWRWTFD
jgi:hypothetical protein